MGRFFLENHGDDWGMVYYSFTHITHIVTLVISKLTTRYHEIQLPLIYVWNTVVSNSI